MGKNPSDTWFYNDWENDEKLKVCSLAAQGLWKRLLCIAARSPERGVVQIGSLNCSRTEGLTHIASAVGHPPQEIAPLIDELVSSGAASVDRKGRIYNRRMVQRAKVSLVRSEAGKKGNEASRRNITFIPPEPGKLPGKPPPLQDSNPPNPLLINSRSALAVSASASPDGPPRPQLPDSAKWAGRLAEYRPWEGKRLWQPFWGPRPDSMQRNAALEHDAPNLRDAWLAEYAAAKKRGDCA